MDCFASAQHGIYQHSSCSQNVSHLTSLSLEYAKVVCMQDCSCVTSLVELKLHSAHLLRFHCRSVAACLSLKSLTLSSSVSSATVRSDDLDEAFSFPQNGAANVPAGLSALTALTHLELECPRHGA